METVRGSASPAKIEKDQEEKATEPERWRMTECAIIPTFHRVNADGKTSGRIPVDPRRTVVLMEAEIPEEIYEALKTHGLLPDGERIG